MRTRFPDPAETWSEDDARTILDDWRRSGDSIAAFARMHGVAAPRLYWWKKRLWPTPGAAPTLSLVPASIVSVEAAVTIRLPGEIAIEVSSASPSWVAAMIAELTRPLA
jgi:transposase-like protein